MRTRGQSEFRFAPQFGHGGARRGAGRKPKGRRAGVPHGPREAVLERHPLHVTAKLCPGLPSLRNTRTLEVLCEAFDVAKQRLGARLVHFSVQRDHVHLLVEAADRRALSRSMQGLFVRVAKALNRAWNRSGTVFRDRFHARGLESPRQVRHALAYVLLNGARHGECRGKIDLFSSGSWFRGWKQALRGPLADFPAPVAAACSWLLRLGWRRHGPDQQGRRA